MRTPLRGFTAILYKEFIVVLRDPMTLFFMFFPPLIEMIAFGYALDNDVKHMATMALDQDRTRESRQLVDESDGGGAPIAGPISSLQIFRKARWIEVSRNDAG